MVNLFGDAPAKRCKGCREVKLAAEFNTFRPRRSGRLYLRSYCKVCQAERVKAWQQTDRGKARRRAGDLRRYGITAEDYAAMLVKQNGVCAICRRPERHRHYLTGNVRPLVVDHCHRTGRVRGLLCSLCNRAIALFDDDPLRLHAAASYLEAAATDHEG